MHHKPPRTVVTLISEHITDDDTSENTTERRELYCAQNSARVTPFQDNCTHNNESSSMNPLHSNDPRDPARCALPASPTKFSLPIFEANIPPRLQSNPLSTRGIVGAENLSRRAAQTEIQSIR